MCVPQVLPLPDELLLQHATLYDEFKNQTHWPKHVLVHYHFRNEGDIDFQQGLYVLTALGERPAAQCHGHPTWCWLGLLTTQQE